MTEKSAFSILHVLSMDKAENFSAVRGVNLFGKRSNFPDGSYFAFVMNP